MGGAAKNYRDLLPLKEFRATKMFISRPLDVSALLPCHFLARLSLCQAVRGDVVASPLCPASGTPPFPQHVSLCVCLQSRWQVTLSQTSIWL